MASRGKKAQGKMVRETPRIKLLQKEKCLHAEIISRSTKLPDMKSKYRYLAFSMAIWGTLATGLLSSCQKTDNASPNNPSDSTGVAKGPDEDSLKYLMYHIMQVSLLDGGREDSYDLPSYYWYDQVPKLDPKSNDYPNAESLLSHIKSYPKWKGKTVDRYSFLDRTGSIADQFENGVVDGAFDDLGAKGGFGMEVTYTTDGRLWVIYADRNSPAGRQGIRRSWQITAVNGNSDIAYDGPNGPHVQAVSKAIYQSDQTTLTFKKPDGQSVTYDLQATPYPVNPLIFDSIYEVAGKKVGYFVLYTFSGLDNEQGAPTRTRQVLDQEFDKLRSEGISDLIVDLRYNGGGSVLTAEYLDSAIAPASANGKLMYRLKYNDKMTQNAGALGLSSRVDFSSPGGLQLDHVFFITSRFTASASELTLNNLKPYMPVTLVGDTTYGKPVGFLEFTISDYDAQGKEVHLGDLYAINFATENAAGVGDYFEGIPPDVRAEDYVGVPWGDNNQDENLFRIFHYIQSGNFGGTVVRNARQAARPAAIPGSVPDIRFRGMVDYRTSRALDAALKRRSPR